MTKPVVRSSLSRALWPFLFTLALAGAACSDENPEATAASAGADDAIESAAGALTVEEQSGVNATEASLATPLNNGKPQLKVKPILECVEQISKTTYVAHFGWDNAGSGTAAIPVGPTNRFFPAPKDRAQGTTFAKGRQKDKVKVTFSDAYVAWILDGRYAIAVKSSPRCPSPPPLCPDSCDDHNPCTADICNKATAFKCAHRPLSSGTSCSDKNVCNGAETCQAGDCKPGKTVTCVDDKNPCTVERCDANLGCVSSNVANGTKCTLAANCGAAGQQCKAGKCVASAAKCDDGNPCTSDVCASNGKCSHSNLASGTTCQDMNVCNGNELCNGKGVCTAAQPVACTDDGNACTIESCDVDVGCLSVPGNEGGACRSSDGKDGTCGGGVCFFEVSCPDDGNPCTDELVVGAQCTHPPKTDGTACNDGNPTTQSDHCTAGVCAGSRPASGFDRLPACLTCEAGGIASGDCDPSIGCSHILDAADRALCEGLDRCMRTTGCWAADPLDCLCGTARGTACASSAANGPCKAEIQAATKSTDPVANGTLFYSTSVPAGFATQQAACDRDICPEQCTLLTCPGINCDDNNPCTVDGCLAAGCGHVPGNNGNACTAASGASGTCAAGVCTDPLCKSLDPCKTAVFTNGACVISNAPNGTACSDGVRCTTGDVCSNGTCGGQPVVCPSPTAACAGQSSCSEATGTCVYPPGAGCGRTLACLTCEQGAVQTGDCDSNIGCSHIADAADRALCEALDSCIQTTGCASVNPLDCLCGTATGIACASTAANGVCKAQIQAATKTTDPVGNGTLFYSFTVPAGFATQQVACDHDFCPAPCGMQSCQTGGPGCDDKNPCTVDTCAATGACTNVSGNDGAVCTGASGALGVCTAGTCRVPLCQSSDPCKTAVISNGVCVTSNAPDGTACSDGLFCTVGDKCSNGTCLQGQARVCEGTSPCGGGAPFCSESAGACLYPPGPSCGGDRTQACLTCEQGGITSGDCDPNIGCSHVTNPADRALCDALDRCIRTTGCWSSDPLDCLCGTARGTACASTAANGACKAEIQAATKTTDPVANGTLFYSFAVPAGFATQQSACDLDICPQACQTPAP